VAATLRKDLAVFVPRDRFLVGLVYLLGHPTVLPNQEAFFWLGVGLAAALVVYIPVIEWYQESERMLSSLPIRRSALVLSRYFSSMLACGLSVVAWVCSGRLLSPLLVPLFSGVEPTRALWTTLEGVLALLVVVVTMTALFLPLYFRFGLGRGILLFFGLFLILQIGFALLTRSVSPGKELAGALAVGISSIGPGWVLFGILIGLGCLLAFSERLSVRFYRKRDL
jgi:hypothetical protein